MRQTLMVAAMAVMMSCGADGNTPWDENHDGLITACEGLNSHACDATPGCAPVPVACETALRSDGTGFSVAGSLCSSSRATSVSGAADSVIGFRRSPA